MYVSRAKSSRFKKAPHRTSSDYFFKDTCNILNLGVQMQGYTLKFHTGTAASLSEMTPLTQLRIKAGVMRVSEDGQKIICRYCSKEFYARRSNGISQLNRLVRRSSN